MTTRREFLKMSALWGAAAVTFPMQYAFGQEAPAPAEPNPAFPIGHGDIRRREPRPRVITVPDVGNYKVLKGDFHIHTLFSDGQVMPNVRVQEAVQNGLDCISITDHIEHRPNIGRGVLTLAQRNDDHNISYTSAKTAADNADLILIRGTEITKSEWHFNAIFLEDVNKVAAEVNDWRKMLAAANDQGAFVFWNHPSWLDQTPNDAPFGRLTNTEPMRFFDEMAEVVGKKHLHGIEVFNGTSHYPIVSDWCNEHNIGLVTTSDIHASELQQYGVQNLRRPMTLVLAEERTEKSIREAFFAHRTVGWAADMIFGRPEWVAKLFTACVDVAASGRNITLKNKSDIPMNLHVRDTSYELKPQGEVAMTYAVGDAFQVTNWYVGAFKPLEVTFASLMGYRDRNFTMAALRR